MGHAKYLGACALALVMAGCATAKPYACRPRGVEELRHFTCVCDDSVHEMTCSIALEYE